MTTPYWVAGEPRTGTDVVAVRSPFDGTVRPEPTFDPAHVAAAVVQMGRLPLEVSVPFTTMLATGMPFLGRG